MANVNPISGVPFGQEKTKAARLARATWELEQASKIRASKKPVGWEHLVAAHEKTARAYEALARETEEHPQRAHATMKAPVQLGAVNVGDRVRIVSVTRPEVGNRASYIGRIGTVERVIKGRRAARLRLDDGSVWEASLDNITPV